MQGSEIGDLAVRSPTSKDGLCQLILDTPLGEQTEYEATSIPDAMVELQLEDEPQSRCRRPERLAVNRTLDLELRWRALNLKK